MAGTPPAGTASSLGSPGISPLTVTVAAETEGQTVEAPGVWSRERSEGGERGGLVLRPGSLANDLRAGGGRNCTLTYLDLVSL